MRRLRGLYEVTVLVKYAQARSEQKHRVIADDAENAIELVKHRHAMRVGRGVKWLGVVSVTQVATES